MESKTISAAARPLQGTKTQAQRTPLAIPDDDNTPLPATISVTLPRELVERFLFLLDTKSVLTCKLVNREFNAIIRSSTLLQYLLACTAAGVIDNPQSPLSYAERLEVLKKREDAWRKLKPVFNMTISVNRQTATRTCRSTEGVYFLSDDNLKDLNYCHLTSFPQDNLRWIKSPGHGPSLNWSGIFVNFVAALYEHDLIVNLTSTNTESQTHLQQHSLDLVVLKFSTGEYHPLARRPRIHIQTSPEADPWVVSRIVGDNLALVVHSHNGTFADKLFIFDWKTGRKLLQHETIEGAYSGLVFVTPELLLVPNSVLSHFEVWQIPIHQRNDKIPIQILSLQIPAVSPEYSLLTFDCYGEPNPFLHSLPYLPPRPFFSSSEDSIIMVKLRMLSNSYRSVSYDLIMHRRALLDTIQTWTSPSLLEQQECLSAWLMNKVTVQQITDLESGLIELDAQSKFDRRFSPRTRSNSPTFAISQTPHQPADSGSSSDPFGLSTDPSNSRCTFLQVPWTKWGPPISRWFVNQTQVRWMTVSYGQRYAFSEFNLHDQRKLAVNVADFNPHNVRRNAEMTARLRRRGENHGSNGSNEGNEEEKPKEFEILDHEGVFSEEVHMGLKCVIYHAPDGYDFDVVLMDEQRLLGVKLTPDGRPQSVQILYIG